MQQCILLNADYSFLNIVGWRRAMCLMAKGKTRILKYSEKRIGMVEGKEIKIPAVIKLIKFIRVLYVNKVPFSKNNILIRDGHKCAYCGEERGRLTIDHIIPKSRGGKTNFENCVACCKPCNNKKGNKLPSEINMYLKFRPHQPTISEFLRIKMKKLGINELLKEMGVFDYSTNTLKMKKL